ncbi:hypothetical protein K402DRAFT_392121 [Aulographum hederae CBS 113979]|uniref:Uncharacterized protein n=1 Tax=Aulographum hederae CBS 113979 TaxID=1176131 RepID=A0A6G1H570_9PEZI|nr:hypothetical protein K402DRAFT_392121 [Aulographum hederae CBS 113979]
MAKIILSEEMMDCLKGDQDMPWTEALKNKKKKVIGRLFGKGFPKRAEEEVTRAKERTKHEFRWATKLCEVEREMQGREDVERELADLRVDNAKVKRNKKRPKRDKAQAGPQGTWEEYKRRCCY